MVAAMLKSQGNRPPSSRSEARRARDSGRVPAEQALIGGRPHGAPPASIKSRICDDIVRGAFDPGTRLTIDMLATRYDSSHMPVREALRELAGEGLIRYEANRGARALPVDRRFIENIFSLRIELEPMLARAAAARISDQDLSALGAIQAEFEDAVAADDNTGAVEANGRFHRMINEIADNPEASAIVDRHWLALSRLWAYYGYAPDRFVGVISDHRSLMTALSERAADDVAALMRAHVIKAKQQLLSRVDHATSKEQATGEAAS